ncbi:dihydroorotate dehydrogenase [Bradyrhizobium sp. BR13661]|jgi:hypothetical protein|nr:dihydroorotate dehydrogenase [Bradyrhizobium sp. BR13661]
MRCEKPRQWTDAEQKLLIEMATEGASALQIASALRRYIASVKRVAETLGIQLR